MANIVKICGVGVALSLALPSQTAWALTENQPAKEEPDVKKKPRLICKTTIDTGSRFSRGRVCKPQEDWNRDNQAAARDLEEIGRTSGDSPR